MPAFLPHFLSKRQMSNRRAVLWSWIQPFLCLCPASGEPEGGKWWKAVWLSVDENHQEKPSQGCGRPWTLNSIWGTDWQFYTLLAFPTIWSSFLSWIQSELDCQMIASGFRSHLFSCFVNVPPGHFQSPMSPSCEVSAHQTDRSHVAQLQDLAVTPKRSAAVILDNPWLKLKRPRSLDRQSSIRWAMMELVRE